MSNKLKHANLIEKAADFLANHKWTRHFEALDEKGREVSGKSKKAVCYCAIGALEAVAHKRGGSFETLLEIENDLPSNSNFLDEWNDFHAKNKAQVIAQFRRTVRRLRKEANEQ